MRTTAQETARWLGTHGTTRVVLRWMARRGDPTARLLVDPAAREDPVPFFDALRTGEMFVRGMAGSLTVRHDVCAEVLRSDDFATTPLELFVPPAVRRLLVRFAPAPSFHPVEPPSMLVVDPPTHTRYRRLVTRAFTARAVARWRERTEAVAAELLDGVERAARDGDGTVDLVARYAAPLPVAVICGILGVPDDMRAQFLAWGEPIGSSLEFGLDLATFRRVERALTALDDWMRGHLRRLRDDPGDDLLSTLVHARDDDGSGLSEDELVTTAGLVLAAGFETTVGLIGSGIALLLAHPAQRAVLADDPSWWPNAVEEIVRRDPPILRTVRRAVRDTAVAGRPVAAGTMVDLLLAGANHDPRVFPEPRAFDVTRAEARQHLSFGHGIHHCVGAALARMEGEVALRALLDRFPALTAAGPARRRPTSSLRGYDAMPVALAASGQLSTRLR